MPGSVKPRAYVASPFGFTEHGRDYYVKTLLPALGELVEPLDPWAVVTDQELAEAAALGRQRSLWLDVGARNAALIRQSALVIAVLEGQEVDSGTAAEVGYAAALGRPIYALRSDLRLAGEPEMSVNLQVEYFVTSTGGAVSGSLKGLLDALTRAIATGAVRGN
jgi:nucleoside 2-deoxyribosyltransferase